MKNKGISVLIIVRILAGVLTVMSINLSWQNLEREKTLLHETKILEVTHTVEACMEEALLKLNGNHSYVGESFYFNTVFCIIEVTEDSEDLRTVRVFAHTESIYSKEIIAQVEISNTLEIISWNSD